MSGINDYAKLEVQVNGEQAKQKLKELEERAFKLRNAIASAALAGDKIELKKLRKEFNDTQKEVRQMRNKVVEVENVMKRLDKATPNELNNAMRTLQKELRDIERGTAAWDEHTKKIRQLQDELKKVKVAQGLVTERTPWQKFANLMQGIQATIVSLGSGFLLLRQAMVQAVNAFAEMEEEMANTRKYTGMTEEQVADLNREFARMDTRTSRQQLNELAQEAGRLGKTAKEDVLGYVQASDIIKVALVDLGEGATQTIAKLTNIFGIEEEYGTREAMLKVGSAVNVLSQNCTATKPYLVEFTQRMAGVGAQARLSVQDILAFGATLDANGQKVEMSASALGRLTMSLFSDPAKYAKSAGLNVEKFTETLKRSTNEGLLMFLERLHELGGKDGLAVLAPMFKDMGLDGVRMSQVLSVLADKLAMVKWEQEEAAKAFREGTSATREYNIFNNTAQATIDKAKKRFHEMAVELGEKLFPVMKHVYSGSSMMLRAVSLVVDAFRNYGWTILALTTTLLRHRLAVLASNLSLKIQHGWIVLCEKAHKAWIAVVGVARTAGLALTVMYYKVTGAMVQARAAQIALNNAMKKNPITLVIMLLVSAGIALAEYLKKTRAAAEEQRRFKEESQKAAKEIRDVEHNIAAESSAVKRLADAINSHNMGSKTRLSLINEFNNKYGRYINQLLTEKSTAQDVAKAYGEVVKNLRAKMLLEAREDDFKNNVATRYGWEAQHLANYDKLARQQGMAIGGETLKAIAEESWNPSNYDKFSQDVWKRYSEMNKKLGGKAFVGEGTGDLRIAIGKYIRQFASTRIHELRVNQKWDPFKEEIDGAIEQAFNMDDVDLPTGGGDTSGSGKGNKAKEDKFKAEKEWKEREEALNTISYAKGEKSLRDYTRRKEDILIEYYKRMLEHADLEGNEQVTIEAHYQEALQKQREASVKRSVEQEETDYNEMMARVKQRFIDGEIGQKEYDGTVEVLEEMHWLNLMDIHRKGTAEYQKAEAKYNDIAFKNMQKRHKEAEDAEKKHQEELKKYKDKYFGLNAVENKQQYDAAIRTLDEVYKAELAAVGDNAKEKKRIDKAYQEAKVALAKMYNQEIEDDTRSGYQKTIEGIAAWLGSDGGKMLTKSLDVLVSGMSEIFSGLTTIVQAELEIQEAAIEKRYDREISAAEGNNYKVKQLEKQKEKELAKAKREANRKSFVMQVMQAMATTAQGAINAYASAAAAPWPMSMVLPPIAASMALAAGAIQIAAIKKQQQASEASGYSSGGFTPAGRVDEEVGVVHAGEWVASQKLLANPRARAIINTLDYAQRTNTIGSLDANDVSRTITAPSVIAQSTTTGQVVQSMEAQVVAFAAYADTMRRLQKRLEEPFVTVNTVTGDTGIKKAQDEYEKLMRNKSPRRR